jgi:hypothetical protein
MADARFRDIESGLSLRCGDVFTSNASQQRRSLIPAGAGVFQTIGGRFSQVIASRENC